MKPIRFLFAVPLLACVGTAFAEEDASDRWTFKLTPSYYKTTNQTDAYDLNLRGNYGPHAVWLAHYQRGTEFDQSRTGYEYTLQLPYLQLVPSLQVATRGFVGGSLNAQVGGQVFAILGVGRTNEKDYYNLNFDPNDSTTVGAGIHLTPDNTLSVFSTRDNRLHTEQVVNHLLFRAKLDGQQQIIIDLSNKQGRPSREDDMIKGNALSVSYERHNVFIRLAQDRKVNFSNDDQTRITLGFRF